MIHSLMGQVFAQFERKHAWWMKILSKVLRSRKWAGLLAALILLPFDFLVALCLWFSELLYLPLSLFSKRVTPTTKPNTQKASIIIVNWDGRHLLDEFLPSVLEAVRQDGRDHEIIVVDNGSRDDSVEFLKTHYPMVKRVTLSQNFGFARGNNAGVRAAQNDVVIFLNNDMQVEPDFIWPLLEGFQDDTVFAVSSQIFFQDKTRRREETGKTQAHWSSGFFGPYHDQISDRDKKQKYVPIFWAGGGSCAVDRNKFSALNGFDPLYDPFYLEDTDLSYQAWKRGWKSLLAPDSVVVHKHRGTSKPKFGDRYVDNTIQRNLYLFIWKNVTDLKWLISHGCALPILQSRLVARTSLGFETKAFFRALAQLPEALYKRYRCRSQYRLRDEEIFKATSVMDPRAGENYIDFSQADFVEQLGEGWYEQENNGERGFRWMGRNSSVLLFPRGYERFLEIRGSIPDIKNFQQPYLELEIYQDRELILKKRWFRSEEFLLKVHINSRSIEPHRFDFELSSSFCLAHLGMGEDSRELGMIFSELRLV